MAEQRFTSTGAEKYTLRYLFDESNSPVGFGIQYPSDASTYWKNYYFAKNLQGDVIALYSSDYNSSTDSYYGTLVATYEYDPWGKPTGIYKPDGYGVSQTASHVAAYNPFRYRGYRYDAETGFYYLQSRYYDPSIARFLNADTYASTGQGFTGYNMFAYCNNSPASSTDPTGHRAMGPSFVYCEDGNYMNCYFGDGGTKTQKSLLEGFTNSVVGSNQYYESQGAKAVTIFTYPCGEYTWTKKDSVLRDLRNAVLAEAAYAPVGMLIDTFLAKYRAAAATVGFLASFGVSELFGDNIEASTYDMYAVSVVTRYPYEQGIGSMYTQRTTVQTHYFIKLQYGCEFTWYDVGSTRSERIISIGGGA